MVINTLAVEAVFADLVTKQPQAVRLQRQCIQAALARHGGNRAGPPARWTSTRATCTSWRAALR